MGKGQHCFSRHWVLKISSSMLPKRFLNTPPPPSFTPHFCSIMHFTHQITKPIHSFHHKLGIMIATRAPSPPKILPVFAKFRGCFNTCLARAVCDGALYVNETRNIQRKRKTNRWGSLLRIDVRQVSRKLAGAIVEQFCRG